MTIGGRALVWVMTVGVCAAASAVAAEDRTGGVADCWTPETKLTVSAREPKRVRVPFQFKPAEHAVVCAKGFWSCYGPIEEGGAYGPQGNWAHMYNGYPVGALLLEVHTGSQRRVHIADRLTVLAFPTGGELHMGVNDWIFDDNVRELNVTVYRATSAKDAQAIVAEITSRPKHDCTVFVLVDDRCEVYLNGKTVLETAQESCGRPQAFDARLTDGDLIAVSVENVGGPRAFSAWIESPGLATITTDTSWRYADVAPEGWARPGYGERGWRAAQHVGNAGFVFEAFRRGLGNAAVLPVWGRADKAFLRKRLSFREERPAIPGPADAGEAHDQSNAVITVTCDDCYALYVNGRLCGMGRDWRHPGAHRVFLKRRDVIAVHAYDQNGGAKRRSGLMVHGQTSDGRLLFSNTRWGCTSRFRPGWNRKKSPRMNWRRVRLDKNVPHGMRDEFRRAVPGTRAEIIWGEGPDVYFRYVFR